MRIGRNTPGDTRAAGAARVRIGTFSGARLIIGLEVAAVAAGIVLAAVASRWEPAAAPAAGRAASAALGESCAELEEQLELHPEDWPARLRLGGVLMRVAMFRAQDADDNEPMQSFDTEAARYRAHMHASLSTDPDYARAYRLLRETARQAPDRQLRARAWTVLAIYHAHLSEDVEQVRSLERAATEFPTPETRKTLETFRSAYRAMNGG